MIKIEFHFIYRRPFDLNNPYLLDAVQYHPLVRSPHQCEPRLRLAHDVDRLPQQPARSAHLHFHEQTHHQEAITLELDSVASWAQQRDVNAFARCQAKFMTSAKFMTLTLTLTLMYDSNPNPNPIPCEILDVEILDACADSPI